MTNTPSLPDIIDAMPYEVATAMLCEPKARMTASMRRACKRARQTSYSSAVPLMRGAKNGQLYPLQDIVSPERRTQLNDQKLARRPLATVVRWLRRNVRQRELLQVKYLRIPAEPMTDKRAEAARLRKMAVLELAVRELDAQRDVLEDDLKRRAA